MDDQTVFYVLGGALVVLALVLSAIGLRWEGFPGTRGLQLGVTLGVVALIGATAAFAWMAAEEEQEHREHELAEAGEEALAEGDEEEALETEGEEAPEATTTTATEETETGGVDGAAVFADNGCGGCHQLSEAGTSGTTGPPLDASLRDESAEYIETSIVDPNQQIASGYPPDVMPQDYEERLSPEELQALVEYLVDATGARG